MGWKNVKEHYGIKHFVHMRGEDLAIGSAYIPDALVISKEGAVVKQFGSSVAEFDRYRDQIFADPAAFQRLMAEPDTFGASIPVYSFQDGKLVTQQCEKFGWPNNTHGGQLMYENQHFESVALAVERAREDYAAAQSGLLNVIAEQESQLAETKDRLAKYERYAADLEATYPESFAAG